MKKKTFRTAACLLLAAVVLTAFAALASGGAGSQGDPLVTLSYLNDTFLSQALEKVDKALEDRGTRLRGEIDQQIAQREQELRGQLSGSGSPDAPVSAYTAVTLSAGQTLSGEAGCEVLLRSGSAVCVADSASVPGMVDAPGQPPLPHARPGGGAGLRRGHGAGPGQLQRPPLRGAFACPRNSKSLLSILPCMDRRC